MFLDDRCQVDASLISSSTIDSEHLEPAHKNLLTGYLIELSVARPMCATSDIKLCMIFKALSMILQGIFGVI